MTGAIRMEGEKPVLNRDLPLDRPVRGHQPQELTTRALGKGNPLQKPKRPLVERHLPENRI